MAKFDKRPRRSSGERGEGWGESRNERSKKSDYKAKRSFTKNKSYRDKQDGQKFERKPAERRKPFDKSDNKRFGSVKRDSGTDRERFDKPKGRFEEHRKTWAKEERGEKSYKPKDGPAGNKRGFGNREKKWSKEDRPAKSRDYKERERKDFGSGEERKERDYPRRTRPHDKKEPGVDEPRKKWSDEERASKPGFRKTSPGREDRFEKRKSHRDFEEGRAFESEDRKKGKFFKKEPPAKTPLLVPGPDGLIRLNKYLSNSGIASRREADVLIQSGAVKVNGEVITQLGHKIKPGDTVTYGDQPVKGEKKMYLLLNKPKDYITTMDDPRERKTVMELIAGACRERVYPVGRLDRNTTGLLLFTNDGELTTRLTHPKFEVKKVYQVSLNKGLKTEDFRAIIEGVELEDGPVKADELAFVGEGKKEVGIEIHSGRNRIVRRLFEHLGYDVIKLDRVVFAGLTKKDLPRGKWRFLTPKEVAFLKMLG